MSHGKRIRIITIVILGEEIKSKNRLLDNLPQKVPSRLRNTMLIFLNQEIMRNLSVNSQNQTIGSILLLPNPYSHFASG